MGVGCFGMKLVDCLRKGLDLLGVRLVVLDESESIDKGDETQEEKIGRLFCD